MLPRRAFEIQGDESAHEQSLPKLTLRSSELQAVIRDF
jgi:hypothetical protein